MKITVKLSLLAAVISASSFAVHAEPLQAQAFRDMAAAKQFAGIAAKDAQIADQALTAVQDAYRNGQATHADVLKAQQNYHVKQGALQFASQTVSQTASALVNAQKLDAQAAIKGAVIAPVSVPAPVAPNTKQPNAAPAVATSAPAPIAAPVTPATVAAAPSITPAAPVIPSNIVKPTVTAPTVYAPVKPATVTAPAPVAAFATPVQTAKTPAAPVVPSAPVKPVVTAPTVYAPTSAPAALTPAPVAAYATPTVKPVTPTQIAAQPAAPVSTVATPAPMAVPPAPTATPVAVPAPVAPNTKTPVTPATLTAAPVAPKAPATVTAVPTVQTQAPKAPTVPAQPVKQVLTQTVNKPLPKPVQGSTQMVNAVPVQSSHVTVPAQPTVFKPADHPGTAKTVKLIPLGASSPASTGGNVLPMNPPVTQPKTTPAQNKPVQQQTVQTPVQNQVPVQPVMQAPQVVNHYSSNQAQVDRNTSRISKNERDIKDTREQMKRGLNNAAAMTGLHYHSNDSYAVSVGTANGDGAAIAGGLSHSLTEHTAVTVQASTSLDGGFMASAGFSGDF